MNQQAHPSWSNPKFTYSDETDREVLIMLGLTITWSALCVTCGVVIGLYVGS